MLTVQLGSDGAFSGRNNSGAALQLVIDIAGYYVAGSPPAPGGYVPIARTGSTTAGSTTRPLGGSTPTAGSRIPATRQRDTPRAHRFPLSSAGF